MKENEQNSIAEEIDYEEKILCFGNSADGIDAYCL